MPSSSGYDRATLRQLVIDWLDDNYHFGDAARLITGDEMSFIETGILDSVGFVQLVLFLEDKLGLKIDRQSLTRENFDGLRKIVDYVVAHPGYAGDR